jgi:pyruvate/2-oxoglutarate dehydrogenase complex dihydrolipoamide dehydrogenase (E3) component
VSREGDGWQLVCERGQDATQLAFDRLLVAVGRRPRTGGFGLETLDIDTDARGAIEVDETLRTRYPNIFACGDVAGPYQFTHAASHQAWHATVNALFGGIRRFKVDYSALPWVIFTDPEIAHVGHNESSAAAAGIEFETVTYDLAELDRAIVEEDAQGMVALVVAPRSGRIIGATVMGPHAGEMLTPLTMSVRHGLKLGKLLSTIHPYPTLSEANRFAAGRWRERHAPVRLLAILGRWHSWRLGASPRT